jgi:hypothetical protein
MAVFGIRLALVRRKAFQQASLILHQTEAQYGGVFDNATFRKTAKSYSLWLPGVIDSFTALHGRRSTVIEQERGVHYFICSSLFDNFFDEKLLTFNEIKSISFNPENFAARSFSEKAFLHSHLLLLNATAGMSEYLNVSQHEFDAQVASMKQFDKNISDDLIKEITFKKGGNAVLLCRYYLDVRPSVEEEHCWYQLGVLIQFSNDLFDVYKDLQEGIQTLAVRCTNAYAIEKLYIEQVNELKYNIVKLPFKQSKKVAFSIVMASAYSLGLTAIENLKKIQGNNDQLPNLKTLPRKHLIMDMESPVNLFKWFKQVYKHGKL